MEENVETANDQCCLGCLASAPDVQINDYNVKCDVLKTIFETSTLRLCFICKRMAEHAETFVQNVQKNQVLLENFHGEFSTLTMVRPQPTPLLTLEPITLDVIQLIESEEIEESFIVHRSKVKVKQEVKEEDHIDELDECFDDFHETYVKEEDDFPLKDLLKMKEEIDLDNINLSNLSKALKKKKLKTKQKLKTVSKKKSVNTVTNGAEINVKLFRISLEEYMEERLQDEKDPKYYNCTHKCTDCVKGFADRTGYDKHMKKHNINAGKFVCDICKQRRETQEQMYNHKKAHFIRYKCGICGLVRMSRTSMVDHYTVKHCERMGHFKCAHCPKLFLTHVHLRKHVWYAHNKNKSRATCDYCNKTYATKDGLRLHMYRRHPKESSKELCKRYICNECGMGFTAPSHLKNHSFKHTEHREYYCVECDKSFKTEHGLKHHLKTTTPHINYRDLPLSCLHCDKKFSIRRDLDRHMNRVHLNVRPYACDKCDKAYVNDWSLTQHKRFVHEGYKRPLKYPCSMCDKVFDTSAVLKRHTIVHTGARPHQCTECQASFGQKSVLTTHVRLVHLKLTRDGRPKASRNSILKSHVRTHTGERPYQCSQCPASFSQSSVLGTHVKLVHLRLTRDGRPKASANR